ncbi:MAG: CDP-glycerol glycerophosphotransferase family protein [Acidobacteriota bacterium]
MSRQPPVLLLSVANGAAAGNIVRTGVVRHVLDGDPDVEVVLMSPLASDAQFAREVSHPRLRLEELPPHRPAGLEARLMALVQAGYIGSHITESVRIRRMEARANGTIRWIGAKRLLAQLCAPSIVNKQTRYALVDRLVSHPSADRLFERHRPTMLVTSSAGLIFSEIPLLRTAVRRGVWSAALDSSWDNFTNKLLPVRRVNRLLVWNDVMKQQAIDLHGYEADEIRVVGTPQWDRYFRDGVTLTREAFCARVGADPARKLVTVTTTPRELYAHHDHVIRVLVAAIRGGAFAGPAQVLVRLHPRDELRHYTEFDQVPEVILEKPFRQSVRSGDGLAVDVTADAQQHLADTLRHSDVIVNVASTIAVEAAIFDTPLVNVAFDGDTPSAFARSAQRYYRFTHYTHVTRHGGVQVAWTPDELVTCVARYLADPSLDRDGRRRVALEQCQFLDGHSAERAAGVVIEDLARLTGLAASKERSCA